MNLKVVNTLIFLTLINHIFLKWIIKFMALNKIKKSYKVHDVNEILCNVCDKPLKNRAAFTKHRRRHFGSVELDHVCITCGKRCKERRHLLVHCKNKSHQVKKVLKKLFKHIALLFSTHIKTCLSSNINSIILKYFFSLTWLFSIFLCDFLPHFFSF